jgi:glycine betaine/choline ABC-type transport system substrate-binding protein
MKTVILSHKVKDYKEWKKHFDADTPRRTKAGLNQLAVGTKSDDKHEVYMIFQTSDVVKAQKMMEDPELKATMQKAGVISEPKVLIID